MNLEPSGQALVLGVLLQASRPTPKQYLSETQPAVLLEVCRLLRNLGQMQGTGARSWCNQTYCVLQQTSAARIRCGANHLLSLRGGFIKFRELRRNQL